MPQNCFQRQIQFQDVLLEESWRSTEFFLEKLQKIHLEKKQGLIRKRWCSKMLKKLLVFIQFQFSTRKGKKLWDFSKKNIFEKKSQFAEKTKRK